MTTFIIINEKHKLLPDQERVLNEELCGPWELFPVPDDGWTYAEMKDDVLHDIGDAPVVFVSPIPALILMLAGQRAGVNVWVMHNDNREAKELPGGRIIHTVSREGWRLV